MQRFKGTNLQQVHKRDRIYVFQNLKRSQRQIHCVQKIYVESYTRYPDTII